MNETLFYGTMKILDFNIVFLLRSLHYVFSVEMFTHCFEYDTLG